MQLELLPTDQDFVKMSVKETYNFFFKSSLGVLFVLKISAFALNVEVTVKITKKKKLQDRPLKKTFKGFFLGGWGSAHCCNIPNVFIISIYKPPCLVSPVILPSLDSFQAECFTSTLI